jgi:hypothetical protein
VRDAENGDDPTSAQRKRSQHGPHFSVVSAEKNYIE